MTNRPLRASRILIVEDEAIVARDVRRMLAAAGHGIGAVASSAHEAVEWLAGNTPDLALVDIALPEGRMAGLDLARRLRDREIRFVFVTAHVDGETLTTARALAPVGYVVKPFTEAQLTAALELALHQPAPKAEELGRAISKIEERLGHLTSMLASAGLPVTATGPDRDAMSRMESLRHLSTREREVLALLLANRRVPHIAERLFISQHTVRTHLKAIFRKLGVHSQAELIEKLSAPPAPASPR
ncbi:MAG: DNA-binding response regulator [Vicinamibacterales bacterium]